MCAKHKKEIEHEDASIWDFVDPGDLERTLLEPGPRKALATAKRVLSEDEFGEVHVHEEVQSRETDGHGSWTEWNEVRHGVLNEGEKSFCWL